MGTRADFYVGRRADAEWIGSIAWDGYSTGIPADIRTAPSEVLFRENVAAFLKTREDATLPSEGWPWPWANSQTTDYSYAFDVGRVYGTCFAYGWWPADEDEPEFDDDAVKTCVFPEMDTSHFKRPGSRGSGMMVFSAPAFDTRADTSRKEPDAK